jgi:hypothetical protein
VRDDTINGGQPHAMGERGQRHQVTFFNPATFKRQVLAGAAHSKARRAWSLASRDAGLVLVAALLHVGHLVVTFFQTNVPIAHLL